MELVLHYGVLDIKSHPNKSNFEYTLSDFSHQYQPLVRLIFSCCVRGFTSCNWKNVSELGTYTKNGFVPRYLAHNSTIKNDTFLKQTATKNFLFRETKLAGTKICQRIRIFMVTCKWSRISLSFSGIYLFTSTNIHIDQHSHQFCPLELNIHISHRH